MKGIVGLILVFFGLSWSAFAQPEGAAVETINGKKYYVHIVEQGNTLYGIHQLYNTSIETILSENNGLTNELALGQKILIPVKISNEQHYGKHVVKQGETLYGISKKYNCSVDDLKNLNNDLSEGISPGQEIVVPKKGGGAQVGEVIQTDPVVTQNEPPKDQYSISVKDSIVKHTVLPHETMYSISKRYMVSSDTIMALNKMRSTKVRKGDVLLIPVKRVNYEVVEKDLDNLVQHDSLTTVDKEPKFKDSYKVALMLPLMLDRNDREMSKPLKLDQVREIYSTTKISFDFYQGFILAADSLAKAGLNVDIYVYDTKRDTAIIGKCFKKPEFQGMDLVVGPLYKSTIKYTAKLCAKNEVRMVLPFNTDSEILYQNPYVYKGVASNMTLLDGVVDYILEKHKHHNIILVKPSSSADLALFERVRERYNEKAKNIPGCYTVKVVETGLGSSSGRELNNIVKKDTTNVIIVPSTNLTFVSGALSRMNKVLNMNPYSDDLHIVSFGLEDWNKYDDIDIKYRNRTNQHYASYRFLDLNTEEGVAFIKAFRAHYGTDPNVYSSQGFDFGMYFMSALHLYGSNFDLSIGQHRMDLIQNDFMFRTIEDGSGRENRSVRIVKYDNYKLVEMN